MFSVDLEITMKQILHAFEIKNLDAYHAKNLSFCSLDAQRKVTTNILSFLIDHPLVIFPFYDVSP